MDAYIYLPLIYTYTSSPTFSGFFYYFDKLLIPGTLNKMCRTLHSVLQSGICAIQMLVRIFITVVLMIENLIRMILQTFYNFISFMLQMVSLLPICVVFLVTSRLKCFMCGGGGPCQIQSGGGCDCLMSAVAIIIVFFILRATGLLDKIFYKLGYAKAKPLAFTRFVPTPGDITECSRNDTDYSDTSSTSDEMWSTTTTKPRMLRTTFNNWTTVMFYLE